MNANELANLLEVDSWYKLVTREEIATMLRQQQNEIEALKKEAALQRLSDFTQEAESFDRTASHMAGEYVSYPLKELTDAITLLEKYADKLEDERPNKGLSDVVLECVEILRKAQYERK
jgi:hypothetical protein